MAGSDEEWGCNDGTKSIAPGGLSCHVLHFHTVSTFSQKSQTVKCQCCTRAGNESPHLNTSGDGGVEPLTSGRPFYQPQSQEALSAFIK